MIMRLIYLCTFGVVLALMLVKADFETEFEAIIKACRQEVSITNEDQNNFYKGIMDEHVANDNYKCFVKCTMEKERSFANGSFDAQAFVENSNNLPILKEHQTEVVNAVKECKMEKGTGDCDTAFKIAKCLRNQIAKLIINL